jgi:hypothetical protein
MTRLFYGTGDFELKTFAERRVLDEIEMLLAAFDCVMPDDSGVYCSSDVTTGRRLYFEVYERHGVRSDDELKSKLGAERHAQVLDELVRENIARCVAFTESLRSRGLVNLINPGPLSAPGFTQQHYHYLWERVILKKVYEIYFNEDWEYSNGCTLEYAIGRRKGIPLFDHFGRELRHEEAVRNVERAVAELRSRGIRAEKLERNLSLIKELSESKAEAG